MKPYDEELVLRSYVIQWCREFMTKLENDVIVCSQLTPDSLDNPDPVVRQKVSSLGLSPESRAVLDLGMEEARQWVVDHVLDREGDRICINRCPSCNWIVRTPLAQQCLWCGHDWH